MIAVPHFALPFRFSMTAGATPQAATVEQDSIDEIAGCVLAILLCPRGYRVELPEFGIEDPTFSTPRVDVEELRAAIEFWEPRAAVALDEQPDLLDQLLARVSVLVQVRTEE